MTKPPTGTNWNIADFIVNYLESRGAVASSEIQFQVRNMAGLPVKKGSVRNMLARLTAEEKIARLRQGVYCSMAHAARQGGARYSFPDWVADWLKSAPDAFFAPEDIRRAYNTAEGVAPPIELVAGTLADLVGAGRARTHIGRNGMTVYGAA